MMENDTQNFSAGFSGTSQCAQACQKLHKPEYRAVPPGLLPKLRCSIARKFLLWLLLSCCCQFWFCSCCPVQFCGTLTQPSTAINNDLEVAANVIQLRNAVSDILQASYEDTLAEIDSERASLTYSDIDDSVGGHVSYNAFQLISMYCAYQGQDDYTKISLANLSAQVQAHRTEYYTYTTSAEIRTEPVQKRGA